MTGESRIAADLRFTTLRPKRSLATILLNLTAFVNLLVEATPVSIRPLPLVGNTVEIDASPIDDKIARDLIQKSPEHFTDCNVADFSPRGNSDNPRIPPTRRRPSILVDGSHLTVTDRS